jgi:hypothetical protein
LRLQELNTARSTLLVGCFARDFSNGYWWILMVPNRQSIWEPGRQPSGND